MVVDRHGLGNSVAARSGSPAMDNARRSVGLDLARTMAV